MEYSIVFILLITLLLDFLREINGKAIEDKNGKKKFSTGSMQAVLILAVLEVITLLALAISWLF